MGKSHNIPEYDDSVDEIIAQINEIVIGT